MFEYMHSEIHDGYESGNWVLKLIASSGDEPQRVMRYLTGVLLGCGGWVLTRTMQGMDTAELDFEFARAACVDIYAALIASGLELSRDSHQQMVEFCHCTQNLMQVKGFDVARIDLMIFSDKNLHSRSEEEAGLYV